MKQKTILTLGLILSLLTVLIIVFREEIKAFLKGEEEESEPVLTVGLPEVTDIITDNEDVLTTYNNDRTGYSSDGSTFTSGSYIDLRSNENLSQGSENLEVLYLQNQINNVMDSQNDTSERLVLDGYFGPETERALVGTFGVDNITVRDVNDNMNVLMS